MAGKSKLWALVRRDYVGAGDRYYQEGRLEKAAELYARAGRHEQAARTYLRLGDTESAVRLFLEAGLPREAGEARASAGDHRAAIELFERADSLWQAAESALKLGRDSAAGRFYERAGGFRRAATCYESGGQIDAAIRAWELETVRLEELNEAGGTFDPGDLRQVLRRRAALLEKVARYEDAAEIRASLEEPAAAASLWEKARVWHRAVEAYHRANAIHDAARLLPDAEEVPARLRAEILSRNSDFAEAARVFEDLGDLEESASAYEKAGETRRAALLWERLGEHERAAGRFLEAGMGEEAGRCFELGGDDRSAARVWVQLGAQREAAECYERLGQLLAAGLRFLEAGDTARASRALQRIGAEDADFEAATFRLLPLLLEEGLFEGALHRLSLLGEGSDTSVGAVERLYWEGRVHEGLGEPKRAAVAYEKAAALDREFADLRERLSRVQEEHSFKTRELTRGGEAVAESSPRGTWWVAPGDEIGERYRIERELGRGGMSRVYEALDREFGDRVAIKILVPRADDDHGAEERLLQEVRICRRISHPNVVRVFDFGRFAEGLFITMELLEGTTLDERVRSHGPLSLLEARRVLSEIISGLAEAHRRRVIHRDLKPMNVFLTEDGTKIMDFGIARSLEGDPSLTRTGHVIGSPMFMSPEQLQGKPLDGRSDLYSLGVLAFFTVAGREPFTGNTPTALALKHLGESAPRIGSLRADTPEEWEVFVGRLLEKKRDDRYETTEEVMKIIETLPVEGTAT